MPRVGADLFGNGRTAVKVFAGRYVTPTNSDRSVRWWSESSQPRGDDDEPGVDR